MASLAEDTIRIGLESLSSRIYTALSINLFMVSVQKSLVGIFSNQAIFRDQSRVFLLLVKLAAYG